jgi:predicted GIY-YIG superfamily endonuclease
MSRRALLLIITSLLAAQGFAQTVVTGRLYDSSGKAAVANATVQLFERNANRAAATTLTDGSGQFRLSFSPSPSASYFLRITHINYDSITKPLTLSGSAIRLGDIYAGRFSRQLGEVRVTAAAPPVKQKKDTVELSASQFKVNKDATGEDLVRKMPGITVENGTVKAQGEEVRRVTIDGRQYFGDDATLALRNLPAEIIDKIQVFDRLSDQAQFTGFDDGNSSRTINVVTRGGARNSQFGKLYAGYGTDNRYSVGGNISFFKGDRRIALIGISNNINQQNFATQDLLGVLGNTGGNRGNRGGGQRGGGGGRPQGGGNQNNFLIGQQGGISKTNSFGINFNDLWGKGNKIEVNGSYFFNNSNNGTDETTRRQTFITADSSQYYNERSMAGNNNFNHRINLRFEYKIDSFNTLIIAPNISLQDNEATDEITGSQSGIGKLNNPKLLSATNNRQSRKTDGFNISNQLTFRHAFKKRGRTVSAGLTTSFNNREALTYLDAANEYYRIFTQKDSVRQQSENITKNKQVSVNFVYTEPVGKYGQLMFNYNPSFSLNTADQQTRRYDKVSGKYALFDTSLSNQFDNRVRTHNGGINLRFNKNENMLMMGLAVQSTQLNSEQVFPVSTVVDKPFFNLLPNAMVRVKLSSKSNLRIQYRAATNTPSVTQLQNVINNNNPLFLSTGNANLKQQYTHSLITRFQMVNTKTATSFFGNLYVQNTRGYVSNATFTAASDSSLAPGITLFRGSQLSKPVNLDGYWNLRSFFTLGLPLKFIKSNLNLNAGAAYSRMPGIVNNQPNISQTYNYNLGLVLGSNISELVDFTLSYSANINNVKNSIQPALNNNYFSQSAGLALNLQTKKGWVLRNDVSNQLYKGLTDGFNQQYWLWNASIAKKFLKDDRGDLRLTVFDLLNQNQSISRVATETYVEDLQTQVLRQYFMLTFTWQVRNFGKAPAGNNNQRRQRPERF